MTPESGPMPSDRVGGKEHKEINMPSVSFGRHFEMHPIVFPAGALIVLALVSLTFLLPPDRVQGVFDSAKNTIGNSFGWLYVAALTGFLIFAIRLAFGKYGAVKLGKDDEEPEFGRLTWFSMLFSAGMGIGLVFWSVAEPVYHYNTTPPGLADGLEKSRVSMAVTIFHWGLHPWALYAVVALALAYFGFRRGMPLGFRSLLYPLLGERVWGRTGDVIDTLAIIATLTGVATSLGIGAQQVNAGLSHLFGLPINVRMQVGLIAGITAVATVSVVAGLHTGIRRLSELNMSLAGLLMVLVILGGGVLAFFGSTVENTGAYLQLLPFSSFRTGAFDAEGREWLNSWTVFYWAWWISWSPFVGMFIARVSRGRTIREFIIGVLLVPTTVGIVWLTAFGTSTLRVHEQHLEATRAYQTSLESDDDLVNLQDPDGDLPRYLVQRRVEGTPFAVSERGTLVGPNGGEYETLERGELYRELGTDRRVELVRGELRAADSDKPYEPGTRFGGAYEAEEQPLTPVEYMDAPIINEQRTHLIARLPTVLFALLDSLFESKALVALGVGIATLCIILFFVTSSDSASLVIDIIASGGNPDPPVGTRLFWAITEGLVAASLLLAGGLSALQAASITAALPFSIILILASIALTKSLAQHESTKTDETEMARD